MSPLYQACDWRGWKAVVTAMMEAIEGRATMNREVSQLKERKEMKLEDDLSELFTLLEVGQGRKEGKMPRAK